MQEPELLPSNYKNFDPPDPPSAENRLDRELVMAPDGHGSILVPGHLALQILGMLVAIPREHGRYRARDARPLESR